jgi:UDP-N-acetyl-D-glucosamine dehydrogenase
LQLTRNYAIGAWGVSTHLEVGKRVLDLMEKQTVGVIGLGYVGLPLMMAISESGFYALGFDISQPRIDMLNAGKSYLKAYSDSEISAHVATGRFDATTDMSRLQECEAILICVPTPLNKYREPDLSYIVDTTEVVAKHLKKGQLVVLESTTFPGTTNEIMKPILESHGLVCGVDFFLAYSPEREDPGNINFTTSTMPKIVGGYDRKSAAMAMAIYQRFIKQTVLVSSATTAEAVKLTENIFRAVNIGLVNELKTVFDRMGIDTFEVIDAAKTKPFGFMPFYPGPGWGGHCIPIDPFYLTWKAREFGAHTRFIELAGEINNMMPEYVVERASYALDMSNGRGLNGAKVLVIGVAYKANVDDIRESPSLRVIERLKHRRADVDYYDPFVAEFEDHFTGPMKSVEFDIATISKFDLVIICTHHDKIDWELLVANSKLVIDTRNATKAVVNNRDRIFKA